MKKVFATLLIVASMSFIACGPSAEEQAKEKARQDSIAQAAQKMKDDSVAAAKEAEAKKLAETAHADSLAKGLIKDVKDAAKDAVNKAGDKAKEGADKVVEKAKEGANKAVEKAKEGAKK